MVVAVVVVGWQPDEIHTQPYDVSYETQTNPVIQGFEAQKFTLAEVSAGGTWAGCAGRGCRGQAAV